MFLWKKYNLLLIPRLTFYSVAIWSAQWIPIKAFNSPFSSGALFYQAAWWPNHNGLYSPEVIHNPPPVLGHAVMVTALSLSLSLWWIPLVSKSQRHNFCPLHEGCLLLGVSRKTTGSTEVRSHGTGAPRKDLAPMLLWALRKIWFWGRKNEHEALPQMLNVCTTQWLMYGQCCDIQTQGHPLLPHPVLRHSFGMASSLFFMVSLTKPCFSLLCI